MNKLIKVLALALVLAAPVAISATVFPTSPADAAVISRHHKYHKHHQVKHKGIHKVSRHHIRKHHKSV